MNFQEIASYAEGCLRDAPPPCSCGCPFGLDVRDLVEKVRKGRHGSAWRAYRDAVLFPGIVSALCSAPCKKVCVREVVQDGGGAVDLKKIEQGIVAKAEKRAPTRYAIPEKPGHIAVVGAGLSGLACTFRLGSKGYRVMLYEATERVGGSVLGGTLADEVIDADIDVLLNSIKYDLHLNNSITDIKPLIAENSAVYIATGKEGNDFGLFSGWNKKTLATVESSVFMGGALALTSAGTTVENSIENGLRAAASIEEFLKIGRNEGMGALFNRPQVNEKFYALQYDFNAEQLENPPELSSEFYIAEALRCVGCNCSRCIDACELIRYFKQNPKRIASDLGVTVLPIDGKIKHVASRMINSCNLCGLCTAVCPTGVDTCAAMYASRHLLNASGHIPTAYHDFWMADMEFSQSDEAYTIVAPQGGKASLLFFPGCQLTASLPQAVERTFEFIRREEATAAMVLSCCGIPADWAGEAMVLKETIAKIRTVWESLGRPELLYACSTCKKTFERYMPEVRGMLVYEWLAAHETALATNLENIPRKTVHVYDPCSSRNDASGQQSVRTLTQKAGFDVVPELAVKSEEAACCGFGGQIYSANPNLLDKIIQRRTKSSELPYITYCANCRDLFLSRGKDSRHILEVLFPSTTGPEKRLPTLTERRENRRILKANYDEGGSVLSGNTANADDKDDKTKTTKYDLQISPELEEKMNRLLLLREDVEKAIAHCESGGAKIFDANSGHAIGSHRRRLVTVWVEYKLIPETDRAVIHNVYSHRVKIVN